MATKHSNWRTLEEWQHLNIPLTTPSNEASKMFDASLTQLMSYCDDPTIGGIDASFTKMFEADPNFVMGHALKNVLYLFAGATSPRISSKLQQSLDQMVTLAELHTGLTPRERKHVQAVKLFGEGYLTKACTLWEEILVNHPLDVLALKAAYLGYIYLGDSRQLRDSVARVLPNWKTSTPLYGYLLGMHAFGLEETNLFDQAEKQAKMGLQLNPNDTWSTHSLTHVFEMTGRQDEGIKFLESTVKDWEFCGMLACHHYWHLALHYIEKGNYQQALDIFDSQVGARTLKDGDLFNIQDSCSLLFRLEMEGVNVKSRWEDIFKVCHPHIDDHTFAFNEPHLLLGCLGAGQTAVTQQMMDSIENFIRNGKGTTHDVLANVGGKLCEALVEYKGGNYAKAVELLHPLRYDIFTIGGSNAQRDLFSLVLIEAAIRSSNFEHHNLARALLAERKALKENSPLTDRLIAKVISLHDY